MVGAQGAGLGEKIKKYSWGYTTTSLSSKSKNWKSTTTKDENLRLEIDMKLVDLWQIFCSFVFCFPLLFLRLKFLIHPSPITWISGRSLSPPPLPLRFFRLRCTHEGRAFNDTMPWPWPWRSCQPRWVVSAIYSVIDNSESAKKSQKQTQNNKTKQKQRKTNT